MKTEEGYKSENAPNEEKNSVWQDKTVRWVAIVGGIVVLAALVVLAIFLLNKRGPRPIADDEEDESKVVLTEEFCKAVSKYDMLGEFGEGMAAVYKDGKWGYIDRRGKEVIPCRYEGAVGVFSEGVACVRNETRYDFINRSGEVKFSVEKPGFVPAICEEDACFYSIRSSQPYFVDGECTLYFMDSSNYDYIQVTINKKGEITNEQNVDFPDPKEVSSPYTAFSDSISGLWGLKDANGDIVIPAKYSFIFSNVSDGVALVILEVNENFAEIGDTHFGYADLKGHDTFSSELKRLARKWDKLNAIYQDFYMALDDARAKNTDETWYSTNYFLYDITGDGTPELWALYAEEISGLVAVYSADDGTVKEIYRDYFGHPYHGGFLRGNDYILLVQGHMGYETWTKYTYSGGSIKTKVIYEFSPYNESTGEFIEDEPRTPSEPAVDYHESTDMTPIENAVKQAFDH